MSPQYPPPERLLELSLAQLARACGLSAEHLRELMTESVRARLRSAGPVGVLMSGGLDSTSVAAIAAVGVLDAAQVERAQLLVVCHVPFLLIATRKV